MATEVFQLTTSRRGRLCRPAFHQRNEYFNSRPHEEVDSCYYCYLSEKSHFNSRPHEEVDQEVSYPGMHHIISTHDLTKRSTCAVLQAKSREDISTHDLTKRSTKTGMKKFRNMSISTHDLTKRSTVRLCLYTLRQRYFNSRPHEEVDVDLSHWGGGAKISTHDLTKRSTLIQPPPFRPYRHFNSRPHEEVDYRTHCILTVRYTISTHDLTKRSTSRDASRELMN